MSLRITVTLDDDVFARLKDTSTGRRVSMSKVHNEVLRAGISSPNLTSTGRRYIVKSANLGVGPGVDLESIGATLEALEGASWR